MVYKDFALLALKPMYPGFIKTTKFDHLIGECVKTPFELNIHYNGWTGHRILIDIVDHFTPNVAGNAKFPYLPFNDDYFTKEEQVARHSMVTDTVVRHLRSPVIRIIPTKALVTDLVDQVHPGVRDFEIPAEWFAQKK